MGRIIRIKINWTGFIGSPGYTNLYFEPVPEGDPITQAVVDAAHLKVQTWMIAVKAFLPTNTTITVDSQVAELDEQTGNIEAFWTIAAPTLQIGTAAGAYTAGTGVCVSWSTAGVRKGRRVRGRTFIVPLGGGTYDTDGTIQAGSLTTLRSAANALHVDSNGVRLVVYARTPGAIIPDGGAYDVTGATINDKVAFLSSRRD
jgi:hypothetical protein